MKPVTVGIIAAVAIIIAFIAGSAIEFENGSVSLENPAESDGPLEQVGEALDKAAE